MTSQLCWENSLNDRECASLIKFIANSQNSMCKHINFLVERSDLPGSGVAATLSCDLSNFPWISLLQKKDLNLETVQAIVALKGKITSQEVQDIVYCVQSVNIPLLQYFVENASPKLKDFELINLCGQAVELKKLDIAKELIKYALPITTEDPNKFIEEASKNNIVDFLEKLALRGINIDATLIVSKMRKIDIQTRKKLNPIIMSTPEGCTQLLLKAVDYLVFEVAEDCIKAQGEVLKKTVDLSSVLKFHRGNQEERQQRIQFIEKLLEFGFDPNGQDGNVCPLDVVLEMAKEKEDLLLLLLQHGASIERCTYPRENGTTLVHEATKFAIESGKSIW